MVVGRVSENRPFYVTPDHSIGEIGVTTPALVRYCDFTCRVCSLTED